MVLHKGFEWDEKKAERNLRKHGISFDSAALVLGDPYGELFHVDKYDERHSDEEDRYITVASHPDDRGIVMVIVWTDRSTEDANVTRIVSARPATSVEVGRYVKKITGE